MDKKHFLLCALAFVVTTAHASNPASKEWVLAQIAANQPQLSSNDWNSICTSGSPNSATGCYGNVTSSAFSKVSNHLGDFIRYANINPVNIATSVFVKAFLGGTNTPASGNAISVHVNGFAARCALFTTEGLGIGPGGVTTTTPPNGNSPGAYVEPQTLAVLSINNATTTLEYNDQLDSVTPAGGPVNSNPIYLLCAGYNATDGSTATGLNVTAT